MNAFRAAFSFAWRGMVRRPMRTGLTLAGIAVATFLFTFVESMRDGVHRATTAGAGETRLIVYRLNRFCPFASQLPQSYARTIEGIEGVRAAVPVKIIVNNCRASLDVVTFRGFPDENALIARLRDVQWTSGSLADWRSRSDAVVVGSGLAERRRLRAGDRFDAAGVRAWVAGTFDSADPQDRNCAYAHLGFLQETATRGGTGGIVTQFEVEVESPAQLRSVAAAIDERFATDQFPTSTKPESAFIAKAARDVVHIVRFASIVGWASLAAVFALIANAIALAVRARVRDHAILRTLGWTDWGIGALVGLEALLLGLGGGACGALLAWIILQTAKLTFGMEGVSIDVLPDPTATALGVLLATLLGLLAGALPAWTAARREIVMGLRST